MYKSLANTLKTNFVLRLMIMGTLLIGQNALAEAYGDAYGWHNMPGGQVRDVAIGADNTVWIIGAGSGPGGHRTYRWDPASYSWQDMGGNGARIAVDPQGNAWIVQTAEVGGQIWRYTGSEWIKMPGGDAKDIGIGADGSVWLIGAGTGPGGNRTWKWDPASNGWLDMGGNGARIAVDPQGNAWMVQTADVGGQIWRYTGSSWVKMTGGSAVDIGIGADGAVWLAGAGTGPGGNRIYEWTGAGWEFMSGHGVSISVSKEGIPWMVQSLDYQGTVWAGVVPTHVSRHVVPDVTGKTVAEAVALVQAQGLVAEVAYQFANANTVYDQYPAGGTLTNPGTTIRVSAYVPQSSVPTPIGGWCDGLPFYEHRLNLNTEWGQKNHSYDVHEGHARDDLGGWSNRITGIHMTGPCYNTTRVVLFSGKDYTGDRVYFYSEVNSLSDHGWNDRAQSLRVETLAQTPPCEINLYEHENKGGHHLGYNASQGNINVGIVPSWFNDKMSSLSFKNVRSCGATLVQLYQHTNYGGANLGVTLDGEYSRKGFFNWRGHTIDADIFEMNFNDTVSSLRINW